MQERSTVKGASYFVGDNDLGNKSSVVQFPLMYSKNATFFTFDGNPITRVEFDNIHDLFSRLDSDAAKPKVMSYKVTHPVMELALFDTNDHEFNEELELANKELESANVEELVIFFYDKNGNRIWTEFLSPKDDKHEKIDMEQFTLLDLSEAHEENHTN